MNSDEMAKPEVSYGPPAASMGPWNPVSRRSYHDTPLGNSGFSNTSAYYANSNSLYSTANYQTTWGPSSSFPHPVSRPEITYASSQAYNHRPASRTYPAPSYGHNTYQATQAQNWERQERYSPTDSVDDILASPDLSDYSLDNGAYVAGSSSRKGSSNGKGRAQRRPNNRDEFDGPHQFLQRPPPEVIAMQERDLPHLPTNLLVQEQDEVLSKVNERLSQCAFDFVAKYQFPIPLTQDMRPVERAQDREWTEWVYLLKRLATKRRIPARVLYNGQIKQFITILENSLEMRHAAKHQSRPPKDDRNILQLISAGLQVAKILKDASAMAYLDQLYVFTEQQIRDRTMNRPR